MEDSQKKIVESLKKGEFSTELEVSQQVKNRYLKIRDLIEAENERQLRSAQ